MYISEINYFYNFYKKNLISTKLLELVNFGLNLVKLSAYIK
jgi:hypothetical protein